MLSVFIAYVFTKSCSSRKDLDSRKQWCDNECKQSTGNDSTRVGNDRLCPAFTLSDCIDAHPLSLQGLLTHIHFPYKAYWRTSALTQKNHDARHGRLTHFHSPYMVYWRTSTFPTWSIDALANEVRPYKKSISLLRKSHRSQEQPGALEILKQLETLKHSEDLKHWKKKTWSTWSKTSLRESSLLRSSS